MQTQGRLGGLESQGHREQPLTNDKQELLDKDPPHLYLMLGQIQGMFHAVPQKSPASLSPYSPLHCSLTCPMLASFLPCLTSPFSYQCFQEPPPIEFICTGSASRVTQTSPGSPGSVLAQNASLCSWCCLRDFSIGSARNR